MKNYLLALISIGFIFQLNGQRFQVSKNNRYLTKDGIPFIWLGDTAWELFHRCTKEEAKSYLTKRKEQGFTLIQAVVLAELNGLGDPNSNNDLPFTDGDLSKPIDSYFKHVEDIIRMAEELDLTIGLLPTWGDKLFRDSWGTGPEIFNKNNAFIYGKWLGDRLKKHSNIIWITGGDRNPRKGSEDVEVWRSMANGINEAYGDPSKVMMTFHPQPNFEGASQWFHQDTWFDFNMFQTGHCRDLPVYDNISFSYQRKLIKPVVNGEPIYEAHPVCFNAKDLGYSSAYDIRKAAYLSLFSGAFGHTYGCHAVWQMYDKGRTPVNGPLMSWKESLDLPGANQIKHIATLMKSVAFHEAIPNQNIILEKNKKPYERIQACSGNDFILVYTATGDHFSLNLNHLKGGKFAQKWFNPRTGSWSEPTQVIQSKKWIKCAPPDSGYGHDWVLVVSKM